MSSSKVVPIMGLSTAAGCRSTFGWPNRCATRKTRPAASSFEIAMAPVARKMWHRVESAFALPRFLFSVASAQTNVIDCTTCLTSRSTERRLAPVRLDCLDQHSDTQRSVWNSAPLPLGARELRCERYPVDAAEHVARVGVLVADRDVADEVDQPAEALPVEGGTAHSASSATWRSSKASEMYFRNPSTTCWAASIEPHRGRRPLLHISARPRGR